MSSLLLRKSLYFVDPELNNKKEKNKKSKKATDLIPDNYRVVKKVQIRGKKATRKELLHSIKKLTVSEARKNYKSEEEILKSNLQKLKQIREACKVELEKDIFENLIERAVTKRPITKKIKKLKVEKTAFTEEDFDKFEAEYFENE